MTAKFAEPCKNPKCQEPQPDNPDLHCANPDCTWTLCPACGEVQATYAAFPVGGRGGHEAPKGGLAS